MEDITALELKSDEIISNFPFVTILNDEEGERYHGGFDINFDVKEQTVEDIITKIKHYVNYREMDLERSNLIYYLRTNNNNDHFLYVDVEKREE